MFFDLEIFFLDPPRLGDIKLLESIKKNYSGPTLHITCKASLFFQAQNWCQWVRPHGLLHLEIKMQFAVRSSSLFSLCFLNVSMIFNDVSNLFIALSMAFINFSIACIDFPRCSSHFLCFSLIFHGFH